MTKKKQQTSITTMSLLTCSVRRKWFALPAAFVIFFLELGTIKSFGVLLNDITRDLQSSTAFVGLVIGMANGTSYLLSMINSPLLRHFSPRQVMMVGSAVGSVSLTLACLATSEAHFAIALVMYGVGFSTVYLPATSVALDYFPNSFEIAASLAVTGGGVGIMVLPVVTEKFLELYGWRSAVMLLGALNLHATVSASLIKPVKRRQELDPSVKCPDGMHPQTCVKYVEGKRVTCNDDDHDDEKDDDNVDDDVEDASVRISRKIEDKRDISFISASSKENEDVTLDIHVISDSSKQAKHKPHLSFHDRASKFVSYFYLTIFCNHPKFITVIITIFLYAISFSGWTIFLIPNAEAKGFLPYRAVLLGTIGGLTNIFGRTLIGFFSAKKFIRDEITFLILNSVSATLFVVNIVAESFWLLALQSAILGFTFGAKTSLLNIVVKCFLPAELYLAALSFVFVGIGIAAPVGGAIMGGIFDLTQSYNIAFIVAGILDVTGACVLLVPLIVARCQNTCRREGDQSQHQD